MKIFSWMQSRLNGKQHTRRPNSVFTSNHMLQETRKEEFSDWPQGLLAIGTFGNNTLKEDSERCNLQECRSCLQDQLQDISPEEVGELQKEFTLLLHKHVCAEPSLAEGLGTQNVQLDDLKFLSSLEDDTTNGDTAGCDSAFKSGKLQCSASVFFSRGKDIQADHTRKVIGKKSLSFLLKKMFLCRRGVAPTPRLRDPIPDKAMVEKILMAILHKKIYPQNSNPKAAAKKYLETTQMHDSDSEDEIPNVANDGSKWVKTDSEWMSMVHRLL
ncbi:protein DEEPER ROOTING 1-like isoform X2 [Diospyros lotus]|uniref:protein DEEPER ROOTING 1-like isoform X2 n=1 Tax=Diospyros lotus TaxID=55363 RepID=UPI002255A403|nr:protein DEEPER ROOTING 1-like isoform X2 [Diospyros lotus]